MGCLYINDLSLSLYAATSLRRTGWAMVALDVYFMGVVVFIVLCFAHGSYYNMGSFKNKSGINGCINLMTQTNALCYIINYYMVLGI